MGLPNDQYQEITLQTARQHFDWSPRWGDIKGKLFMGHFALSTVELVWLDENQNCWFVTAKDKNAE